MHEGSSSEIQSFWLRLLLGSLNALPLTRTRLRRWFLMPFLHKIKSGYLPSNYFFFFYWPIKSQNLGLSPSACELSGEDYPREPLKTAPRDPPPRIYQKRCLQTGWVCFVKQGIAKSLILISGKTLRMLGLKPTHIKMLDFQGFPVGSTSSASVFVPFPHPPGRGVLGKGGRG